MPSGLLTVTLSVLMQVGTPAPSETPNFPALPNSNNHYGFEGQFEQRYPFDNQQNWTHGYFQEIPAYGGHVFFRPYNYKDVLSQSQTAAGWGAAPQMPYSQQFWHRYQDRATMLKMSDTRSAPAPATLQASQPQYQPQFAPHQFAPQPFTQPMYSQQPYAPQLPPTSGMVQPAGSWQPAPQPSSAAEPTLPPGAYWAPLNDGSGQFILIQGPASSAPPTAAAPLNQPSLPIPQSTLPTGPALVFPQ